MLKVLRLVTIVFLVSTALAQAPPAPAKFQVIDTMPAYWQFWEAAKGKPVAEQAELFQAMVVAKYPELYTAEVLNLEKGKPLKEALAARYVAAYDSNAPYVETTRRLSGEIGTQLDGYLASFRHVFPDFDYRGRIYILHSLNSFDGGTRIVAGQEALLLGVETIARINRPGADVSPFFHHELFHIYQSQFDDEESDNPPIYRSLWHEGLAVYVSRVLHPVAPEEQIFGRPIEMPNRARAVLPQLAHEFCAQMDSTSRTDYARYFLGRRSPEADSPTIPPRAGYYLGYLVGEELAKKHDLRWLAHAKTTSLRTEIKRALHTIEAHEWCDETLGSEVTCRVALRQKGLGPLRPV
ncbi:MAG: DUF2268 domain-containing putative Zn-dependent protease [Acidobacteriota bacterium]|nr:DUF2268 domain-containing putative Zn-dependent protease [Acidobacteriota bacterium]